MSKRPAPSTPARSVQRQRAEAEYASAASSVTELLSELGPTELDELVRIVQPADGEIDGEIEEFISGLMSTGGRQRVQTEGRQRVQTEGRQRVQTGPAALSVDSRAASIVDETIHHAAQNTAPTIPPPDATPLSTQMVNYLRTLQTCCVLPTIRLHRVEKGYEYRDHIDVSGTQHPACLASPALDLSPETAVTEAELLPLSDSGGHETAAVFSRTFEGELSHALPKLNGDSPLEYIIIPLLVQDNSANLKTAEVFVGKDLKEQHRLKSIEDLPIPGFHRSAHAFVVIDKVGNEGRMVAIGCNGMVTNKQNDSSVLKGKRSVLTFPYGVLFQVQAFTAFARRLRLIVNNVAVRKGMVPKKKKWVPTKNGANIPSRIHKCYHYDFVPATQRVNNGLHRDYLKPSTFPLVSFLSLVHYLRSPEISPENLKDQVEKFTMENTLRTDTLQHLYPIRPGTAGTPQADEEPAGPQRAAEEPEDPEDLADPEDPEDRLSASAGMQAAQDMLLLRRAEAAREAAAGLMSFSARSSAAAGLMSFGGTGTYGSVGTAVLDELVREMQGNAEFELYPQTDPS